MLSAASDMSVVLPTPEMPKMAMTGRTVTAQTPAPTLAVDAGIDPRRSARNAAREIGVTLNVVIEGAVHEQPDAVRATAPR